MKRIRLPQKVRYFENILPGSRLARTGLFLSKDTEIEIGDPHVKVYDHQDQFAVPFEKDGRTYYLLLKEIGIKELMM